MLKEALTIHKDKNEELTPLEKSREAEFKKVDEEFRAVSYQDTKSKIALFKNQLGVGLNFVSPKDKETLKNGLRYVELIYKDTKGPWITKGSFFSKDANLFIGKYLHDVQALRPYTANKQTNIIDFSQDRLLSTEDKDITDFYISSHAFAVSFSGSSVNSLGHIEHIPLISSLATSNFAEDSFKEFKIDNNQRTTYDGFKSWMKNLEKLKDNYNLNEFEYSALVANSVFNWSLESLNNFALESKENLFKDILKNEKINKEYFDFALSHAITDDYVVDEFVNDSLESHHLEQRTGKNRFKEFTLNLYNCLKNAELPLSLKSFYSEAIEARNRYSYIPKDQMPDNLPFASKEALEKIENDIFKDGKVTVIPFGVKHQVLTELIPDGTIEEFTERMRKVGGLPSERKHVIYTCNHMPISDVYSALFLSLAHPQVAPEILHAFIKHSPDFYNDHEKHELNVKRLKELYLQNGGSYYDLEAAEKIEEKDFELFLNKATGRI